MRRILRENVCDIRYCELNSIQISQARALTWKVRHHLGVSASVFSIVVRVLALSAAAAAAPAPASASASSAVLSPLVVPIHDGLAHLVDLAVGHRIFVGHCAEWPAMLPPVRAMRMRAQVSPTTSAWRGHRAVMALILMRTQLMVREGVAYVGRAVAHDAIMREQRVRAHRVMQRQQTRDQFAWPHVFLVDEIEHELGDGNAFAVLQQIPHDFDALHDGVVERVRRWLLLARAAVLECLY